jgi:tetratricopeptide (TPR) repeat protein
MRNLWDIGALQRIAVLVLIAIVCGFSPVAHQAASGMRMAGSTQRLNIPLGTAKNLIFVAENLPWRNHLWEQAGRYALLGGAPETAVSYFKVAAAAGSLSYNGYILFGDAYEQTGNLYTAGQIWKTANHIYGPSDQSLKRLAMIQRETKDFPALINTLKQLSQLETPDFDQPGNIADLYYELGFLLAAHDPASAPPYLLEAAELDSERKDASELAFTIQRALPADNPAYSLMESGRKLADLGKWEIAAHAFQRVIESQPDYGEAWAFLGETLQHVENPEINHAYEALTKAIEIDPTSLPANTFLAFYWQRAGNPDLAIEYLSQAAKIEPDNPDILVDLGAATATAGNLDSASAYYWKAIDLTSRDPAYLREFVNFCIQYNFNLEEIALPIAREAVRTNQGDPVLLDMMGQVLFRLGDLYNAERFLLQAVYLDPEYAAAHLHLGLVYKLQDKISQANASFTKAISLAPGTQTAIHAERLYEASNPP